MPGTGLHVGTATSLPASEQRDNQEHLLFSQFVRKTFHSGVSPAARNDGQNGAVIVTPDEFAGHQRAAADAGPLRRPQVSLLPQVQNDANWPFAPSAAQAIRAVAGKLAANGRKRPQTAIASHVGIDRAQIGADAEGGVVLIPHEVSVR